MAKTKWQGYSKRLKGTGLKKADVARGTGVYYPRLVGFFNGYWDLNAEELAKVDEYLKTAESQPK